MPLPVPSGLYKDVSVADVTLEKGSSGATTNESCPAQQLARSKSEQHISTSSSPSQKTTSDLCLPNVIAKRKVSYDDRMVLMEEFTPLQTSLHTDNGELHTSSWKISLKHFTSKKRGDHEDNKKLSRSMRRYYKRQDELIAVYEGVDMARLNQDKTDDTGSGVRRSAIIMAKVSLFVNLLLLIGKLVVSVLSGSLAVITSVLDSAVDLASGLLMWWSGHAMKKRDPYQYPQGRTRLEPVAIIVLSVVMSLAMVQMIRESVEKIVLYVQYDRESPDHHNESAVFCVTVEEMKDYAHHGGDQRPVFELESIIICTITIVSKLVLFLICRRVNNPATRALAQDHRNDIISNSGAIACGVIGDQLWKYADPVGAILICIYIIVSWISMGHEQMKVLTGHTARPDFLSKLTWIAVNHHEKVTHVDTVRAFHFGNDFLVEVDIVLPADMKLMEAHDIGESLQHRLESLQEVERAFVHLDYEVQHHPHSEHKIV